MTRPLSLDDVRRPALTLVASLEKQTRCAVCWGELERGVVWSLTRTGWAHEWHDEEELRDT